MRDIERLFAATVPPLVVHAKTLMKVVLVGRFVLRVPVVSAPVFQFVTRYETVDVFEAENNTISYRLVVLMGKLAPRSATVGALPATLLTSFQFPVLEFVAIPILPYVVLVVGSALAGAVVGVVYKPIKLNEVAAKTSVPKRAEKKNPPKPAALPNQTCIELSAAVVPVFIYSPVLAVPAAETSWKRLVCVRRFVEEGFGFATVPPTPIVAENCPQPMALTYVPTVTPEFGPKEQILLNPRKG